MTEPKPIKKKISRNGKQLGRPTDRQRLQRQIEKANADELSIVLGSIRVQMITELEKASNEPTNRVSAAQDVKALHDLWTKGKDILADLKREEAAQAQNEEHLSKLLQLAKQTANEHGWSELDDGD